MISSLLMINYLMTLMTLYLLGVSANMWPLAWLTKEIMLVSLIPLLNEDKK